jgi:hypothetical protein
MGTAARYKQKQVEPQLVLCGGASKPVDDAIKTLIEEWFVPALVEEYIRLNRTCATQRNHSDEDMDSLKTEPVSPALRVPGRPKIFNQTAQPKTKIPS